MKLNYCEKCGQMTNHDTHACLKCAVTHTDQFEEIVKERETELKEEGSIRRRFYQMGYDEAEKEYHLGLAELKAAMESLPDSKPYLESDEFDAGMKEMKHACLNVIAERITLLT